MDNVTHSLAGLLLAEGVVQVQARRGRPLSGAARSAVYFTSLLSNNLPDLDFLYAPITHGQLGYLLHHRGMTHTLAPRYRWRWWRCCPRFSGRVGGGACLAARPGRSWRSPCSGRSCTC